jgi:hypothetical protein
VLTHGPRQPSSLLKLVLCELFLAPYCCLGVEHRGGRKGGFSMKTHVLIALLVCGWGVSVRAATDTGTSSGPPEAFFGTSRAWTITISSADGIVSVLDVPKGVVIGISGADVLKSIIDGAVPAKYEFGGDLTIRLRRIGDPNKYINQPTAACLVNAPVELRIGQANVVVMPGEE